MRLSSILLSSALLTTTTALQAAFLSQPGAVANQIGFPGSNSYGVSSWDLSGHISPSQPTMNAYYRFSGQTYGPNPDGAMMDAYGSNATTSGFGQTASALSTEGYGFERISFRIGASGNPSLSFNLGDDINALNATTGAVERTFGVDAQWAGWAGSNLEERIYSAATGDVVFEVYYNNTHILDIAPSDATFDIYIASNTTTNHSQGYTELLNAQVVSGLSGADALIAAAMISDINAAGGSVRLVVEDSYPSGIFQYNSETAVYANATSYLQAVPEPADYAMGFGALALVFAFLRRRCR